MAGGGGAFAAACRGAKLSAGEGAILGARGSVLGIGTDVGGSIRIPAAFSGSSRAIGSGGVVVSRRARRGPA